jgi:hypothetical protein
MTGTVSRKNEQRLYRKLRPNSFFDSGFSSKLEFLKFKLGRKLIKIFRSTVIIGTKIPKTKELFMITELNIYAALVLAGLISSFCTIRYLYIKLVNLPLIII